MTSTGARDEGWMRLLYAVIEQAVSDLRGLQQAGYVRGLTPQRGIKWKTRRRSENYCAPVRVRGLGYRRDDAESLCAFFRVDGECDQLLQLMGSPLSGSAIRRKLEVRQ